jgi:hypothetical protein
MANFSGQFDNFGSGGAIILTLPDPATVVGQAMRITQTVANIITLTAPTALTMYHGGKLFTSIATAGIGDSVDVYCDGTNYFITDIMSLVAAPAVLL